MTAVVGILLTIWLERLHEIPPPGPWSAMSIWGCCCPAAQPKGSFSPVYQIKPNQIMNLCHELNTSNNLKSLIWLMYTRSGMCSLVSLCNCVEQSLLTMSTGNSKQLHHLPDTLAFLQLLRDLDSSHPITTDSSSSNTEELPEVRAARGLFR